MPPALVLRTRDVGVLLGEESSMRLLYSGLNGSGYDQDSRVHGCRVEEHSLVGRRLPENSKKKKKKKKKNIDPTKRRAPT